MKMRMNLGVAAVLSLSVFGSTATVQATEHDQEEKMQLMDDQVIVTMQKGETLTTTAGISMEKLSGSHYTAQVPDGETIDTFIERLEDMPGVKSVEPDFEVELAYVPNDPDTYYQYHHNNINSYEAWDVTKGSSDVVVAVIDNGFDLYHEELYDKWISYHTTATTFSTEEHGTHVAGIIAASMDNEISGTGVAPNVSLIAIDAFEQVETAKGSDLVEAIYLAADLGADVINMSFLSYGYSSAYNDVIQYAHEKGAVLVAAAGNDSTDETTYPAGFENVISVAATDEYNEQAWFSNYGTHVDLAAPGSYIYSTLPYDDAGEMSGTSMASPVVAGVAALVKSQDPSLTNVEIENRLFETATDYGNHGKDTIYGHGLVNAAASLDLDTVAMPIFEYVSDRRDSISGYIPQTLNNTTITVVNSDGVIGSLTNYYGWDYFDIPIPLQKAGTYLTIIVTDEDGNTSHVVELYVNDETPPPAPKVNRVTSASTEITGTSEPNSWVIVWEDFEEIGFTLADGYGNFSIEIDPLPVGTELYLEAWDEVENASDGVYITVGGVVSYYDLKSSHWAYNQIMFLADASIIGGYPDGTFQPNRQTTRAEAARMLASALELDIIDTASIYRDVASSHWANDYIVAATKAGIFTGNPDGTFNPNGKLTRAEMAVLLSTAYALSAENPAHFGDVKASHWANGAIAAMFENDLTVGYPDGTYRPSNPTTRAEFSMFLAKALNPSFR